MARKVVAGDLLPRDLLAVDGAAAAAEPTARLLLLVILPPWRVDVAEEKDESRC